MSLKITEKLGVFYVEGKINSLTSQIFINHFKYFINEIEFIIININSVNQIDEDGLKAINKIKTIAHKKFKTFSIVGKGSKKIYEYFEFFNVA